MDLRQLEAALDILGALDPGVLPLHHTQVFLFIAKQESCTYREIEERFNLSNAAVSRISNALSENARHRGNSLGLVEIFIDPQEGRRYRVRLTKKGKSIHQNLKNIT
tara:strand:- start:13442 stop:13762 length:321 start_codon:yes stop_codon:yes gene_type:complete